MTHGVLRQRRRLDRSTARGAKAIHFRRKEAVVGSAAVDDGVAWIGREQVAVVRDWIRRHRCAGRPATTVGGAQFRARHQPVDHGRAVDAWPDLTAHEGPLAVNRKVELANRPLLGVGEIRHHRQAINLATRRGHRCPVDAAGFAKQTKEIDDRHHFIHRATRRLNLRTGDDAGRTHACFVDGLLRVRWREWRKDIEGERPVVVDNHEQRVGRRKIAQHKLAADARAQAEIDQHVADGVIERFRHEFVLLPIGG